MKEILYDHAGEAAGARYDVAMIVVIRHLQSSNDIDCYVSKNLSMVRVERDGESTAYAQEKDGRNGSSTCLFERGVNIRELSKLFMKKSTWVRLWG
ncbi:hypothetical protein EVAR_28989_1 [Eumeta japonica]|uniref:Uncharacterized protein n=1 Tax=Eumeta variegata TaxID=151549 RepID=A0A4C1W2E7_EUMVA|nr:hypothetical protein EVAR_28989_1 [Eumeta japonica]